MKYVSRKIRQFGAKRMTFKLPANNNNSKQQIYFGGDLDVPRIISRRGLVDIPTKSKGLMLKTPQNLSRIDIYHDVPPALAPASKTDAATERPNCRYP